MRRFLLTMMAIGLTVVSVAAEGSPRVERKVEASYFGTQLLGEYRACTSLGAAGCVPLKTNAGEGFLTARVSDAHGQPVNVWVVDASEDRLGLDGPNKVYGRFCGETTQPISFNPGADLEFWVGDGWWPAWWIYPKLPDCMPGEATTGTIQVTLSNLP
ncbi:MAG TPA: hypothetical protein VNA87_05480 [Actinomycetota bacterium]|nr:hypothetical protein [Actinomycetota bacterium]